jgi:hypothetical protein
MTKITDTTGLSPEVEARDLFKRGSNRENFMRLYRFLSYPQRGFILCRAGLGEQSKMFDFFKDSPLAERSYMLDMADPPLKPKALQEKIIQIYDRKGQPINIFFIYNIDSCIKLLNIKEKEYLERLNFIRDFFCQFDSLFVFFFTKDLLNVLFLNAFDFYDWFKVKVVFQPEPLFFYPVEDNRSLPGNMA